MKLAASTTEYMRIDVTTDTDLSASTPRVAILPASRRDNPVEADWHDAEWVDGATARLLVGPDGPVGALPIGDYTVWINFDPPGDETIVAQSGHLGIV